MADKLLAFIEKYLGVPNTGTNPVNDGQCVGLIEVWADTLSHPRIAGNARDLLKYADPAHYAVVFNLPTNFPPAGAIVVWSAAWGNGFGHCAVVVAATPMELVVFEQNDPEGVAPNVATHSYANIVGWAIPR